MPGLVTAIVTESKNGLCTQRCPLPAGAKENIQDGSIFIVRDLVESRLSAEDMRYGRDVGKSVDLTIAIKNDQS